MKKEIVEQGYNYFDGLIHSMVEFFKTRIENLENIIPTKCSLKKQQEKQERIQEKKVVTFDDSDDEDSDEGYSGKKFCQYHGTYGHTTDQYTTLMALIKQADRKRACVSTTRNCSVNMR